MSRLTWLSSLLLLALAPLAARAADGYVTASVNLRAGPDIGYPRIDTIPVGYSIRIYGCTSDWVWCDVGYRGDRGWVAGSYIEFYDNGYYQPLPQYGAQVGIPIVTFAISVYWSNYYRHRPFYRERNVWYARPIPHRPPPPPPHRPWHRPPPKPGIRPPGNGHRPGPGTRPPTGGGYRPTPLPRPKPEARPQPRPQPVTRPQPRPAVQPPQSRPMPTTRPAPKPAPATRPVPQKDKGHGKPQDKSRDDRGQ